MIGHVHAPIVSNQSPHPPPRLLPNKPLNKPPPPPPRLLPNKPLNKPPPPPSRLLPNKPLNKPLPPPPRLIPNKPLNKSPPPSPRLLPNKSPTLLRHHNNLTNNGIIENNIENNYKLSLLTSHSLTIKNNEINNNTYSLKKNDNIILFDDYNVYKIINIYRNGNEIYSELVLKDITLNNQNITTIIIFYNHSEKKFYKDNNPVELNNYDYVDLPGNFGKDDIVQYIIKSKNDTSSLIGKKYKVLEMKNHSKYGTVARIKDVDSSIFTTNNKSLLFPAKMFVKTTKDIKKLELQNIHVGEPIKVKTISGNKYGILKAYNKTNGTFQLEDDNTIYSKNNYKGFYKNYKGEIKQKQNTLSNGYLYKYKIGDIVKIIGEEEKTYTINKVELTGYKLKSINTGYLKAGTIKENRLESIKKSDKIEINDKVGVLGSDKKNGNYKDKYKVVKITLDGRYYIKDMKDKSKNSNSGIAYTKDDLVIIEKGGKENFAVPKKELGDKTSRKVKVSIIPGRYFLGNNMFTSYSKNQLQFFSKSEKNDYNKKVKEGRYSSSVPKSKLINTSTPTRRLRR